MSTLVAQTISNGTVSTSSENVIQGSAKAWVLFDGTTSPATIRGAYNVSSVSKISTGQYTVNFTNALASANYSATSGAQGGHVLVSNIVAPTAAALSVVAGNATFGAYIDMAYISISVDI